METRLNGLKVINQIGLSVPSQIILPRPSNLLLVGFRKALFLGSCYF